MKFTRIVLLSAFWPVLSQAVTPTDMLAEMEATVVNEDEDTAQDLWKRLAPTSTASRKWIRDVTS